MNAYIQFVHDHPPRCIVGLNPMPTQALKPTLQLPPHLTVYHGLGGEPNPASFVIGCPCGNRAVNLLGYYVFIDDRKRTRIFVGPLSLECPKCGVTKEFFDTRKHGWDGEQGVNTHITGEGSPDRFACPRCGIQPMIVAAEFFYSEPYDTPSGGQARSQDFFGGIAVLAQCTCCNSLVEVTSFECA